MVVGVLAIAALVISGVGIGLSRPPPPTPPSPVPDTMNLQIAGCESAGILPACATPRDWDISAAWDSLNDQFEFGVSAEDSVRQIRGTFTLTLANQAPVLVAITSIYVGLQNGTTGEVIAEAITSASLNCATGSGGMCNGTEPIIVNSTADSTLTVRDTFNMDIFLGGVVYVMPTTATGTDLCAAAQVYEVLSNPDYSKGCQCQCFRQERY